MEVERVPNEPSGLAEVAKQSLKEPPGFFLLLMVKWERREINQRKDYAIKKS